IEHAGRELAHDQRAVLVQVVVGRDRHPWLPPTNQPVPRQQPGVTLPPLPEAMPLPSCASVSPEGRASAFQAQTARPPSETEWEGLQGKRRARRRMEPRADVTLTRSETGCGSGQLLKESPDGPALGSRPPKLNRSSRTVRLAGQGGVLVSP